MHLVGLLGSSAAYAAAPECEAGTYGAADQDIVVLSRKDWVPSPGLGYLILDGRYGSTLEPGSPVSCGAGYVLVHTHQGTRLRLNKRAFRKTSIDIPVAEAVLAGELLEPEEPGTADDRPLVVMVHGSETEPAIGNNRAYILAAQGVSVLTYDKRGTGQSGGFYTQNFELLADDAAAAMARAQALMKGHFSRSGYWGQSQGGWVAPLAATRSKVDFVAVGFGLVTSPIEEDRSQMLLEAQTLNLGSRERVQIEMLSRATARIVRSHFNSGFEELDVLRQAVRNEAWPRSINGEYSGAMLRMSDPDLRRVGRALFDNLELIWDYDSTDVLSRLPAPLLWTIAAQDREAPIDKTVAALGGLIDSGRPVEVFTFPDTDHGMYEFVERPDGTRTHVRITDGYFRLIGDWVLGKHAGPYGRSVRLGDGK